MFKICHDEIKLLNYLKEKIYSELPDSLWNRYLFLYDKLLKIMDYTFVEPNLRTDNICFYIDEESCIRSILCKEVYVDKINFYIFGNEYSKIIKFLYSEIFIVNKSINIYVIDETLKEELLKEFNGDLISGQIKFYKIGDTKIYPDYNCCKVKRDHFTLQGDLSYLKYALQFIEFYGCIYNEKFVATCGIAPITNKSAEIISVNTYDKQLRRKGMARAACSFAMKETSELFKTFIWTADEDNYASRALAASLGFKEYMKKYCIRVR